MTRVVNYLLEKYKEDYKKSISHELTNELCSGTLPDYKLYTYLVQDLKFFQVGMQIFGKTLAYCDEPTSSNIIAKQIGFVANEENDYFIYCLLHLEENNREELESKCKEMLARDRSPTLPAVENYLAYLRYIIYNSTSYVEIITFVYVMEQVYLGWADYHLCRGNVRPNLDFKHRGWIELHSGDKFTSWVAFLRNEVDRVVRSDLDKKQCEETFIKTIRLETGFWNACYQYKI